MLSLNVSKSKFVCIDIFLDDIDSFHADIGTLVFYCHAPPSSLSTTTSTPSKIVDSPSPHSS